MSQVKKLSKHARALRRRHRVMLFATLAALAVVVSMYLHFERVVKCGEIVAAIYSLAELLLLE